jgi:hypothetical protein
MTASISSVALHVVGRYNEAGKTIVAAYRAGGHRLLGTAARYERAQKVTDFLATRLDTDTSRVIAVLDRVAAASTSSIETVASRTAQIESPLAASVIKTVTAINLPIATLTARIADQVADGAKQFEARVAGSEVQQVVRTIKTKAATVRKATVKRARRSAAKSA